MNNCCYSGPIMFTGNTVGIKGDNGITPHIGDNDNWYIGTVDTGIKAQGKDGITPHIGVNNHWYIGTIDTGVLATGPKGTDATITIGTTTTLAAGSNATVTNSGTASSAIFNFGIPQGIPGVGSTKLEYTELRGAVGNSEGLPQLVPSGSKISIKEYRNHSGDFQVNPDPTASYFTFSKTGKYLAIFYICVGATATPGMFNWGLFAQDKAKYMVCTASANLVAANVQYCVTGTGTFDVTDITEKYNIINNSKIQVSVQGITDAQVVNTKLQYSGGGVKDIAGLNFVLVRLSDL